VDIPTVNLHISRRVQWAILIAILLAFAGVVVTSLFYARKQLVRAELDHLAEQARIVEVNLQRQLKAVDAGLVSVIRDLAHFETGARYAELIRRLQALSDTMPGVRTLSVLDRTGDVLASNRSNLVGLNFSQRDYVQTVLRLADDDAPYLSKPFKTILNVYSINLVRISLTADGHVHRIVSATLDPEFFEDLLSSVRYADDVWVAVAHEDGLLAMHQPPRPELLGTDLNRPGSFFSRHKASAASATVLTGRVATTGEDAWMAQRTIEASALNMTNSLVVAVARNPAKALQHWRDMAVVGAAVWALGAIAACVALWLSQRHQAQVHQLLQDKEALRQQAENEIRQMAFYDHLTQLPNRRLLMDRLAQLQAVSLRHGRHSALLFLDLDGFKQLNDTHGHDQGDRLLQEVANRLKAGVREEDTVARLGGDEFVVMLSELGSEAAEAAAQAEAVASKLRTSLSQDYLMGVLRHRCSASIGITLFGQGPEPLDDILKRADRAMYDAKSEGRNGYKLTNG